MRVQAILAAAIIALCLPAITAEESTAATCTVHQVYADGQAWLPVNGGWPLPDDQIEWMEAQGTWHLEDGTPWDPHSIITESITVVLDGVTYPQEPEPTPDPPAPDPIPEPTPAPMPEPTPKSEGGGGTDMLVAAIGIGAMLAAVGILVLARRGK